ncbi:MAG TPA: hypothetical protein VGS03_06890 [Candidatus Polarisedimenticolia bacterium]|nr:hypothetical protein [Candidatus Polarisedimenticolia bacterium]
MEHDGIAPSWQLASGTGREHMTWTARGIDDSGAETTLVCDVALAGRFFGAALEARPAGKQPDFHLDIRGLTVTVSTLERLHDHLTRWLSLPPFEQSRTPLGLDCDMGSLFDQHVRLLLGERADTLSGGRPVATVRYVVGRMTGEMWFATEADGLSTFSEQIRSGLRWSAR